MSAAMNRDEMVRRFEQWLDGALASEEPPRGIDAEMLAELGGECAAEDGALDRNADAYTLWAAMTALAQEVKLQGRAFKDLSAALDTQAGRRELNLEREVERRCRKEALAPLIDMRDCLARGIESVRAAEGEFSKPLRGGWIERKFGRAERERTAATTGALIKGYELAMERLEQTLLEFDVKEIRCRGEKFDPRRMNAVDREETEAVPEGTVLEVYRSGYEWNGEVFRPAQVKVAGAPSARKAHE